MPRRDWRLRIEDIFEAVTRILRYTEGMEFEDFSADEKTIDAVVRNITIIGEAAGHVPEEIQERYGNVPWAEMRGIRNIVIHEYFGVSIPILWKTVTGDLPPLLPPLRKILEE